ncbi:MAG: hypothetical protein K5869_01580 [Saccharofermentans sp.]|nr:hypothetical protein [Saccharofermentans sp.]
MKISKMVPIIVSVVLVLSWVYIGYATAVNYIEGRTASPGFYRNITLKEDVSYVDVRREIDAAMDGESYDHTVIPAGSEGTAFILYGRRFSYIDNPETDVYGFRASFSDNQVSIQTGPESQLDEHHISYKKIENFEEIISEYNQKVKEAKNEWRKQLTPYILTSVIGAALFSILFLIICITANKFKMHPGVFAALCSVYALMLMYAIVLYTATGITIRFI